MAYQELIKNFEKIRTYMIDFYVYGFKSRQDFDQKSLRSYDNERRRIESYLKDYMRFTQSEEGKNVFLSIDSRHTTQNPLYQAFLAKSFTDIDITLHFYLLDILYDPEQCYTLNEIIDQIDQDHLSCFVDPLMIDKATVRKKLKEYTQLGLIVSEKTGKQLSYHRADTLDLSSCHDAICFFAQMGMVGVIGNYLMHQLSVQDSIFTFKHYYIAHALDSEILYQLLFAIQEKREVRIHHKQHQKNILWDLIPLKIFVSTQNGRQYLFAYHKHYHRISSYRMDYMDHVTLLEPSSQFDKKRELLSSLQKHMWGVRCSSHNIHLEHVEFQIYFSDYEEFIYQRLVREKRIGEVERLDKNTAVFRADVFDTNEMIPWIRTFICRIKQLDFSNRTVENQFRADLKAMYELYDIGGDA